MDEGSECIISSVATPQYSEAAKNMQAKWAVPTQAWESWPIRAELAFGKRGGDQTWVFRQRVSTGAVHIKHVNIS